MWFFNLDRIGRGFVRDPLLSDDIKKKTGCLMAMVRDLADTEDRVFDERKKVQKKKRN